MAAEPASTARDRRLGAGLFAAAVLVFLAGGLVGIDDPWEDGFRGANGGFYHGNAVRHWLRLGLGYVNGGAVLGALPGDRPHVFFYLNHPPTYPLLLYPAAAAFGCTERTLRLAALALALPAVILLGAVVRRLTGPVGGGAAALAFAASPLGHYYGPMVNVDGAVVSATLAAVLLQLRRLERPSRSADAAVFAACLFAALIDWGGLWTAPTVAAVGLAMGRGLKGSLRDLFAYGLATALALAAFVLHAGVVTGEGAAGFLRRFSETAAELRAAAPSGPEVLAAAGRQAFLCGAFLPLAVVGAVRLFRSGGDGKRSAAASLALLLPGVLHAVAHPKGFVVHEFWFYEGLPGVAALAGAAVRKSPPRSALVLFAAAAAVGVATSESMRRDHAGPERKDRANAVRTFLGPKDAGTTNEPFSAELFYIPGFVMPGISTPEALGAVYAQWRAEPRAGDRFVFFTHRYRKDAAVALAARAYAEPFVSGDYLVFAVRR